MHNCKKHEFSPLGHQADANDLLFPDYLQQNMPQFDSYTAVGVIPYFQKAINALKKSLRQTQNFPLYQITKKILRAETK